MRLRVIALIVIGTTLAGAAMAAWQSRDTGAPAGAVPTGSGVLSGRVVTDTADPQPVRRVTVRLAGAGSTVRLVGTDDDGRFVFDRLPAGRLRCRRRRRPS